MHETIQVLAVLAGIASVSLIWLLMHLRATRQAACRWRERPPIGDDVFLKECEIPNEPLRINVALAARYLAKAVSH